MTPLPKIIRCFVAIATAAACWPSEAPGQILGLPPAPVAYEVGSGIEHRNVYAGGVAEMNGFAPAMDIRTTSSLVTNSWIDSPIRQAVRDISLQTGTIIAVDPSVADMLISMDVVNLTVEETLRRMIMGQGMVLRKVEDNFFLISSALPNSPSFDSVSEGIRVDLKYITAPTFQESLPPELQQYVFSGKKATELFLYAPPELIRRIEDIVRQMDTAPQQIVMEALIIELNRTKGSEFGVDWERLGTQSAVGLASGAESFIGRLHFASIPEREFRSITVALRMLVQNGEASIKSRPRVATLNGGTATIEMALEQYFSILTDVNVGYSRSQLQVVKSGVILKMTPQIGEEGDITVDVSTEVGDVGSQDSSIATSTGSTVSPLPVVRRRKVDTRVRVKEGDAIVIGGLVESQERSEVRKVPVLGSIPLLGALFRKTVTSNIEKEAIIFITPRIMADAGHSPDFSREHKELDPIELHSLLIDPKQPATRNRPEKDHK